MVHEVKKHVSEKQQGSAVDIVHGKIHRMDIEKIDISTFQIRHVAIKFTTQVQ